MDPVSCVALATGAYKTLRAAISTGKDLQDMTGTLSQWGKAFSDFANLEEREKNPPFWKKTFRGSDEETALEIFAQKKKMEQMRAEIKDHDGSGGRRLRTTNESMSTTHTREAACP